MTSGQYVTFDNKKVAAAVVGGQVYFMIFKLVSHSPTNFCGSCLKFNLTVTQDSSLGQEGMRKKKFFLLIELLISRHLYLLTKTLPLQARISISSILVRTVLILTILNQTAVLCSFPSTRTIIPSEKLRSQTVMWPFKAQKDSIKVLLLQSNNNQTSR